MYHGWRERRSRPRGRRWRREARPGTRPVPLTLTITRGVVLAGRQRRPAPRSLNLGIPMNHARASCAARAGNFTQSDHSGCINRDAVVMQIQTKYLHSVPWTSVRRCFGEIVVQLQGSCISVTNYQPGYFVYTTPREKAWILDGLAWQNFCASCLGRTTMRRTGKTVRGREEYSQLCTGILVL